MTTTPDPGTDQPAAPAEPVLRVVRGNPDAAELGALVAVLAAASGSSGQGYHPRPSAWAAPSRGVRAPLPDGGWRRSSAPR